MLLSSRIASTAVRGRPTLVVSMIPAIAHPGTLKWHPLGPNRTPPWPKKRGKKEGFLSGLVYILMAFMGGLSHTTLLDQPCMLRLGRGLPMPGAPGCAPECPIPQLTRPLPTANRFSMAIARLFRPPASPEIPRARHPIALTRAGQRLRGVDMILLGTNSLGPAPVRVYADVIL